MKGRTWCIEFLDDAKKDGDVSVKWKVIQGGAERELSGTWEGYRKGMTARQKATRFYNKLKTDPQMSRMVGVTRAGNTVCFQLKDGAPFDDIAGVDLGDETGQTFRVYDDPAGQELTTVRMALAGEPEVANSHVRLGVGALPRWAQVPTHKGRTVLDVATILENLANEFNKIFEELGYTATVEGDEVVIPEVPCELGATAGTDDTGLSTRLKVQDPSTTPFAPGFDKSAALDAALAALADRLAWIEDLLGGGAPPAPAPKDTCKGIVIEQRHADGTVRYFLDCDGECPDGECSKRRSRNHHGGVREWCGCSDREPRGCHIVIYTPGDGEGGGPQEVLCAGACPDGQACRLERKRISPRGVTPEVYVLRCKCTKREE